jgi:hypothetical protein
MNLFGRKGSVDTGANSYRDAAEGTTVEFDDVDLAREKKVEDE